jgi:hypothetical protein
MFENLIEFKTTKNYLNFKEDLPEPIKFNLPQWYKVLKHNDQYKTVKGCIPFLETLTTGYLLKIPRDYKINFNKFKGDTDNPMNGIHEDKIYPKPNLNINFESNHHIKQLQGSPLLRKNLDKHVSKFVNPWIIKTPPGYSCLFISPLNNSDDRFSIIPGIVNTDKYDSEINFPFIVNGDKYPYIEDVIKKGTPYVQIIPFKRENWKMKLSEKHNEHHLNFGLHFITKKINLMKSKWWSKTSWN